MRSKTCIIGAGPSGLAAAKIFAQRGLPFNGFEMGSDVGGLWRYENDNGRSPAYRSLHTNTSRDRTAFSDFAMPSDYPDYPSHEQMLAYLEAYAERFDLRRHIRFGTQVLHVGPRENGVYEVRWRSFNDDSLRTDVYDSIVVASGHHWHPHRPDFPGSFAGIEMHSRAYREPEPLAGRRVLVVGIGNSACDIAVEVSRVAERTFLSTRRSAHVIPKYLLGRPLDTWLSPLTGRLPWSVQRSLFKLLIYAERGRQEKFGLRLPEHDLGAEHPTVSSDLLPLIRDRQITPKPDVKTLLGDTVRFADGSEERIDAVIYATGYHISFPFLKVVEDVADTEFPLFHHVVHPSWPGLYFLGLVQPLGAVPPMAEAQARWVADLVEGRAELPSADEMQAAMTEQEKQRRRRYVNSKRHRLEVDAYAYLRALRREQRAGRRRAASRRSGGQAPAPAPTDVNLKS